MSFSLNEFHRSLLLIIRKTKYGDKKRDHKANGDEMREDIFLEVNNRIERSLRRRFLVENICGRRLRHAFCSASPIISLSMKVTRN